MFLGLRALLYLAAVDSAVAGGWLLARPGDLLDLLRLPLLSDAILLERVLGALWLGHAVCLVLAAVRPGVRGELVLLPLLGRTLAVGLWFWLLGTERVQVPVQPLLVLLGHDMIWLPGFIGFLFLRHRT
jgi:hypothetical protein